jgi:aromatic-amino-acid transaminase
MTDLTTISPLFASVELAPRDPMLGLTEAFNADTRPRKVNLGVGVYQDDNGKLPLLAAVRSAERTRLEAMSPRGYQPIDGSAVYNQAVQALIFGSGSRAVDGGRVVTAQALGGTGALKVGADLLRRILPSSRVYLSDPSWENHRALFEASGYRVDVYPYYDAVTHGVDFDGMSAKLTSLEPGSIVVLHACCHNPTGADLSRVQWTHLVNVVRERHLVPFIDMAYQGFADGIEPDATAPRLFAEAGLSFLIASSFSKSLSLYGERVGALSVVTGGADEAARVLSQLKRVVRTNYSSPPTHGGAVAAAVLSNAELRQTWETELNGMRERILGMRAHLVEKLRSRCANEDFSFLLHQRGMFSYTGLRPEQVERLKADFAIYAVSTGRICVAALNSHNIDYVADAIAQVIWG